MHWKESRRTEAEVAFKYLMSRKADGGFIAFGMLDESLLALSYCHMTNPSAHQVIQAASGMEPADENLENLGIQITKIVKTKSRDTKFKFIIPIGLILQKDCNGAIFRVLGHRISLVGRNQFHKQYQGNFSKAVLQKRVRSRGATANGPPNANSYLVIDSGGNTIDDAWNNCAAAYETVVGMIEFAIAVRTTQLSFGGRTPLSSTLVFDQIMVMHSESVEVFNFHHPHVIAGESSKSGVRGFESKHRNIVKRLILGMESPVNNSSVSKILSDTFRAYGVAMCQNSFTERMLGFWRVAEIATLSKSAGGNTEYVASRLAWMLSESNDAFRIKKSALSLIAESRNYSVHDLGYDVSDENHVNVLKMSVDLAIIWLISNKRVLNRAILTICLEKCLVSRSKSQSRNRFVADTLIDSKAIQWGTYGF